jgi:hypothetical protein
VVGHFGAVIRGEEQSLMAGEHGLKVVRVLEQAQHVLDRNLAEIAARRKLLR